MMYTIINEPSFEKTFPKGKTQTMKNDHDEEEQVVMQILAKECALNTGKLPPRGLPRKSVVEDGTKTDTNKKQQRDLQQKYQIGMVSNKLLWALSKDLAPHELHHEKTGLWVSDQVRHKPGCAASEDHWRLDISDLENRGIVLTM